jgi:arylsulfatase A-like enzyme
MFGCPGPMLEGWNLKEVLPALEKKAVEYIHTKKERPFFLYMPLTAPHTPIAPAEQFKGKSQAGAYGDFVHQIDHLVGQLMKALEQNRLADNTIFIFTSDNGSPGRDGTNMCGDVNSVRKYGHNPSYIYRGIKADIWDGGHRIPFIAQWPKHVSPGMVSHETICLVDFMATIASVLGVKLPENAGEDSYSILPALTGEALDKPIREATIHHSGNGMFAIRQGKWKLILGKGSGGWSGEGKPSDPPAQLYDMEVDESERRNLYNQHPEVAERLEQLLEQYKQTGRSTPN